MEPPDGRCRFVDGACAGGEADDVFDRGAFDRVSDLDYALLLFRCGFHGDQGGDHDVHEAQLAKYRQPLDRDHSEPKESLVLADGVFLGAEDAAHVAVGLSLVRFRLIENASGRCHPMVDRHELEMV